MTIFDVIYNMDPALIVLCIMSFVALLTVISWHRDTNSDFHLKYAIVDSVTGKISIEKIGFMTTLFLFSWGFVALYLKDKLSMEYVYAFGGIFALGRIGSQGLTVLRDIKTPLGKDKDDVQNP